MTKSANNNRQASNTVEPGSEIGHRLAHIGIKEHLHGKLEISEAIEIGNGEVVTNKPEFVVIFQICINDLCDSLKTLNHSGTRIGVRQSFTDTPTVSSGHEWQKILPHTSKQTDPLVNLRFLESRLTKQGMIITKFSKELHSNLFHLSDCLVVNFEYHICPCFSTHSMSLEVFAITLFLTDKSSFNINSTKISDSLEKGGLRHVGVSNQQFNIRSLFGVFLSRRGRFVTLKFITCLKEMLDTILELFVFLLELFDLIR